MTPSQALKQAGFTDNQIAKIKQVYAVVLEAPGEIVHTPHSIADAIDKAFWEAGEGGSQDQVPGEPQTSKRASSESFDSRATKLLEKLIRDEIDLTVLHIQQTLTDDPTHPTKVMRQDAVREIMELIASHTQTLIQEARINENRLARNCVGDLNMERIGVPEFDETTPRAEAERKAIANLLDLRLAQLRQGDKNDE